MVYGVEPHKGNSGASSSFLNSESHLFRQSKKSVEKSLFISDFEKEKIESGKMEKWRVLLQVSFPHDTAEFSILKR